MRIWGPYSTLGVSVAAAAAMTDQLQKAWTIGLFDADPVRRIALTPFFDLVLVWNRGISYGLFKQDSDAGRWALAAFSLGAVLALVYWLARFHNRLPAMSAGLIAGGALGNAIDRVRFGAVADFFSFHIGGFQWYIFNLADVAIVAGVAGLLFDSLLSSHKSAGKQA
ncbi:MAG: signal peptidase II [Rhodomicrobium sp.]